MKLKTYDPQLVIAARETATQFYEALGLRVVGTHTGGTMLWGIVTDDEKIIKLLKETPFDHVEEVKRQFWNIYGFDLVKELENEMSHDDLFSYQQHFVPYPKPSLWKRFINLFKISGYANPTEKKENKTGPELR